MRRGFGRGSEESGRSSPHAEVWPWWWPICIVVSFVPTDMRFFSGASCVLRFGRSGSGIEGHKCLGEASADSLHRERWSDGCPARGALSTTADVAWSSRRKGVAGVYLASVQSSAPTGSWTSPQEEHHDSHQAISHHGSVAASGSTIGARSG